MNKVAWFVANANDQSQSVGKKLPNAFGLYDMHGNVWEWCWDRYSENTYLLFPSPQLNPRGAEIGKERVLRGGSWFNNAFNARSTLRFYSIPNFADFTIGFRIVRNGGS